MRRNPQRGSARLKIVGIFRPAAAVSLAIALAACGSSPSSERHLGIAEDRLPNRTASDWVTYADYVVEVTPSRERALPVGKDVIVRGLTMRVERVLWSNPHASQHAPASFGWTALGWSVGDDGKRVESAVEDEPRLERGHTYLMAIDWVPRLCSPGDKPEPAAWFGLGSDAIVPYDHDTVGEGELEGRHQSAAALAKTLDPGDPNYSFEDAMTGKSAADVRAALHGAPPEKKQQFGPDPAMNRCG